MMMNEEAMTNEEAIKLLSQVRDAILASNSWLPSTDNPIKESFGMAINALKAQEQLANDSPELDKENGELIRRKAAIDVLYKNYILGRGDLNEVLDHIVDRLEKLPSAQPETHGKRTETHACDCIDRQAAIDALEKVAELYPWRVLGDSDSYSKYNEAWQDALNRADSEIEALPSAQPEIIRCGQCKYAEVADKEDAQDGYTCQFHRGSVWFSGSYCSWAERRTDGV